MKTKTKNILFLTGMAILFGVLYGTDAFLAEGPSGKNGFSRAPALAADGEELAFVHFDDGISSLYAVDASGGEAERLLRAKEGRELTRPAFSPDGEKIAYIKTWREEGIPYSQLMMYDLETGTNSPLQSADSYIKEAVFTPDGNSLYITEADSYDEQPEGEGFFARDYDIHRLKLDSEEKERLTDLSLLSMSSLDVFPDGERILYSYFDQRDTMRIYDSQKESHETLSKEASYESGMREGPYFGAPSISSNGERIAFSDVTRTTDGTFEYEIFSMNIDGTEVRQITEFYEMATEPEHFPDGERMLVTVDQNFAGRNEEFEYWSVDLEGNGRDKIEIDIPEEKGEE